eukprot:Phypoly_transcript_09645.p1 GENE.Phypoly_transcript_09645~~Phypoly_transcript_09645.p1  ORF type:complete len:343 (+),score=25.92 Phypoly_transcript_09645:72-1100(+)
MNQRAVWLIVGMLVTGTINTLSKSWQNVQTSKGINGQAEEFHFPWTQTLIMYCGETLCMVAFLLFYKPMSYDIRGRIEEREINQTEKALLMSSETDPVPEERNWKTPFLFLFASSLDLIGTTLAGIGLLHTLTSVYQMLRGSIIIFSGILSVFFLKRKLFTYNWLGICITTLGLVVVGLASYFIDLYDPTGNKPIKIGEMLYGNCLIVAGQFANAVQFIVEEIYLKKKKFTPLFVVGAEGVWGVVMMCAFVLPLVYFIPGEHTKHYENALEAFVMIYNSHRLLFFVIIYWLSIACYNFFGLSVAKELTAVHRTFIDAVRTIFVCPFPFCASFLSLQFYKNDF